MNAKSDDQAIEASLKRSGDIVELSPQIVGRFYPDGNRLGQRPPDAPVPPYYSPERWIGSSTQAANPPEIPPAGLSVCADLPGPGQGGLTLRELLRHDQFGPRLLGERRWREHAGSLRVLIKLLDAREPIFFHVHADDRFVAAHSQVYPNERFGKDEAYHFLDLPKGHCPYTHLGVLPGVTARDVVAAMRRGTEHVLELSPSGYQRLGEGFMVRAGLLHRPGTAVTLEIQQPSDVYTLFQTELAGQPLPESVLHPGFADIASAAESVVNWAENQEEGLLAKSVLKPTPVAELSSRGGRTEWIFPPDVSAKFSGLRLTVESSLTVRFDQPCVLFVWRGQGTLNGRTIAGGGGRAVEHDEFFIGIDAAQRGLELSNSGDAPLVAFALFAAAL